MRIRQRDFTKLVGFLAFAFIPDGTITVAGKGMNVGGKYTLSTRTESGLSWVVWVLWQGRSR